MAWGTSNRAVTRHDFYNSGLAAGYSFKAAPPGGAASWNNDLRCITAGEARAYICCNRQLFWDYPDSRVLVFSKFGRMYQWSFRYSATSCTAACSQGTSNYFSPLATDQPITEGTKFYLDCNGATEVPTGYYLDAGNYCHSYTNGSGVLTITTTTCASYNHYLVYYKTCGADCSTMTNNSMNISTTSTLVTGKYYEDGTNVYLVQGAGSSGGLITTIMSGPYDTCNAVLCSS